VRWAYALLLLAGCDRVFALTHVNGSPDAPVDVPVVDTKTPMPCVATTIHDEDGDGIVDNCDTCPTVTSTDADADNDGLADACDPNLSTSPDGDKILLASMFASTSDLSTNYTQGGTTNAVVSGDTLILQDNSNATTVITMTPTKIVAAISAFQSTLGAGAYLEQVELGANGVQCAVSDAGCANEIGQICISLGLGETKNVAASEITSISLWKDTTGTHCVVDTRAHGQFGSSSTGAFTSSKGFVRTTTNARAVLTSLVFYGEK
jgi:hypothetical protein